jgi:hypothetical protein
MKEPAPHILTLHFSHLIGRKVSFQPLPASFKSSGKSIYGIYKSFPSNIPIIVKADLSVIGSLAGALVGLPNDEVLRRIQQANLEEVLRDAIAEIFNVASSVIATESRAQFSEMAISESGLCEDIAAILSKPTHKYSFSVSVDGYQGGAFQVLA